MRDRTRRGYGEWKSRLLQGLPALLLGAAAGCASPGQPKPPSLHLPQVVRDLSAERIADRVELHWTTPATTTDNLPAPASMTAVICRTTAGAGRGSCAEVSHISVAAGRAEARDVLAGDLAEGPVRLLWYRVEILNAAGRSAGRSAEAFAAAGSAPAAMEGMGATAVRGGVRLEWRPESGDGAVVELERSEIVPPDASKVAARPRTEGMPGTAKQPAEVRLSAGGTDGVDAGGTVDRSVLVGASYRYRAQRVRTTVLGGQPVTLRSALSDAVTVKVLDTFPPQPPAGLAAVAGGGQTASIDLSWRPGAEADLAGYNVYRTEVGSDGLLSGSANGMWQRVNKGLVAVPAFEDMTAGPGQRYGYRVTAVDDEGNESAPGNEVQETSGTR